MTAIKIIYKYLIIACLVIAVSGFIIVQINNRGEVSSNNTSISSGNYTTPVQTTIPSNITYLRNSDGTNSVIETPSLNVSSNFTMASAQGVTVIAGGQANVEVANVNGTLYYKAYGCSGSKEECDEKTFADNKTLEFLRKLLNESGK